ncbi:MAG: hypothetical protein E7627_06255 [Ruminococcaceae bacterium]|nr:hypothetical protein [Oscillospiraceae bacterium]
MKNLEIRRVIPLLLVIAISIFLSLVGCTHVDVPDAGQSDGATESNAPVTEIEPIETEPANTGTVDTDNESNSKFTISAETEPVETESPIIFTTEELHNWAKSCGILESIGAEDRAFDSLVTRAEFVKMLMTAVYLTPDSEIGQLISEITDSESFFAGAIPPELNEEYARLALDYGLLRETDPMVVNLSANITRYDAYILIARIAGLSYQAEQYNNEKRQNDGEAVRECLGEIYYLTMAGILVGDNAGYMESDEISLEEACDMLKRTVDYTEQGYRTDITVKSALIKNNGEYEDYGTIIDTKIIECDGIKYISFSKFVEIPCKFFPNVGKLKWSSTKLEMYLRYGDDVLAARGGYSVEVAGKQVNIRVSRGDIMLPVYIDGESLCSVNIGLKWDNVRAIFDDSSKVLYVDLPQDDIPLS